MRSISFLLSNVQICLIGYRNVHFRHDLILFALSMIVGTSSICT
jgi:hypothetical protein